MAGSRETSNRAVANQAQDPKGTGGAGYAIGDLDVGPKPTTRAPSGQHASVPQTAAAQPAQVRAPNLGQAAPANSQSGTQAPVAAKAKAAKIAGGGQIAAFDDEPAQGSGLGLELDLEPQRGKKPAAPAADTSSQMGYDGKSIGDGFGEPESGVALDI